MQSVNIRTAKDAKTETRLCLPKRDAGVSSSQNFSVTCQETLSWRALQMDLEIPVGLIDRTFYTRPDLDDVTCRVSSFRQPSARQLSDFCAWPSMINMFILAACNTRAFLIRYFAPTEFCISHPLLYCKGLATFHPFDCIPLHIDVSTACLLETSWICELLAGFCCNIYLQKAQETEQELSQRESVL